MSSIKCISNSAAKSIDYNRSSSKRLYEFVFKIIDHDEMEISSFDQYETNGSKITTLLNNQSFIESLHHKIKGQGLYDSYPILKVSCKNLGEQGKTLYTLDVEDLVSVFEKFGKLYKIYITCQEKVCYIFFKSFFNAFVAMKLLNSINLRSVPSQLCVEWCPTNEYEKISCYFGHYYENVQWPTPEYPQNQNQSTANNSPLLNNQTLKQNKLTCRYNIQIQNQKQFQVARRIIGAKGTNMKKIIETAIEKVEDKSSTNTNQLLKLRLRGKGSGYKEGPEQVQSDESLHLCISAKDERVYNFACESVEKLLQNVYLEYLEFTKKQGSPVNLQLKKIDITPQQNANQGNEGALKSIQNNAGRLQADKIQQLLEMRNKARRELNFSQADRIRNYLRSCGVCLIDEKGRRGKATEVTTWKYLI